MMRCPLPIDWLEYLEGAGSGELDSHLSECRPCQFLVEELRHEKRPSLEPVSRPGVSSWPHWSEAKEATPKFGDIWWTTHSASAVGDLPRVPVLLLSNAWREEGHTWCELVPLSTDVENATSLDLLMSSTDTDINVAWRALLRHQTIAEIGDLASRIGCLTDSGEALLKDVINGHAPVSRFGPAVEDPEDTRPQLPEDVLRSMQLIGRTYAEMLEGRAEGRAPRVVAFPMRPVVMEVERRPYSMRLAASTGVEHPARRWTVEIPRRGHLGGRIDHIFLDDMLVFVIDEIVEEELGLEVTAWIAAWWNRVPEPVTSDAFDPKTDRQVLIGKGLEVFPREITRLEIRLSDET